MATRCMSQSGVSSSLNDGALFQVTETEADVSTWKGFAVWNSATQRVAQEAGKFGQQTRMILTTDFKRKVLLFD